MVTARADSYSIASGADLYAGRPDPALALAWLPAPGTIADISLNTLFDVRGTHVGAMQVMNAWNGAAWAPWWGELGSMILTGGGHVISTTVPDGNAVYRYDVASRLFTQIKPAATQFAKADNYVADTTTGWLWANATEGNTDLQTGEPFSPHTYAALLAIPESGIAGSAANGWLVMPGSLAMSRPGQRGTGQAHKLRLGVDTLWTTQNASNAVAAGYGFAVHDPVRNRIWTCRRDPVTFLDWRDLSAGTHGTQGLTGAINLFGYYCVGGYDVANDLIMWVRAFGSAEEPDFLIQIADPVTNVAYKIDCDTGAPATLGGAWEWSESWRCWIYYPGNGGNTVYFLHSPANPRTGTWTWSSQTFTGTARSYNTVGGAGAPYTRLRHVPAHNLLVWASQSNFPMQGIRLSETP